MLSSNSQPHKLTAAAFEFPVWTQQKRRVFVNRARTRTRSCAVRGPPLSPRPARPRAMRLKESTVKREYLQTQKVREFSVNTASTLTCYKKRRCVSTFFLRERCLNIGFCGFRRELTKCSFKFIIFSTKRQIFLDKFIRK